MYLHTWIIIIKKLFIIEMASLTTTLVTCLMSNNTCISSKQLYVIMLGKKITVSIIVLKQNVNTVDVVHSTKIYPPPHRLFRTVYTYWFCPHTRRYVSVYSVICCIYRARVCRWLCSDFVLWQIIYIYTNIWKNLWNAYKPETCFKALINI